MKYFFEACDKIFTFLYTNISKFKKVKFETKDKNTIVTYIFIN